MVAVAPSAQRDGLGPVRTNARSTLAEVVARGRTVGCRSAATTARRAGTSRPAASRSHSSAASRAESSRNACDLPGRTIHYSSWTARTNESPYVSFGLDFHEHVRRARAPAGSRAWAAERAIASAGCARRCRRRSRGEPLDDLVAQHLPASHAPRRAAPAGLFFSLPAAFDPESVGPCSHRRSRSSGERPLSTWRAHRHAGVRRTTRSSCRRGGCRSWRRATRIPMPRPCCRCGSGRVEPHRPRRHAPALHRQHRRRGGRERHQVALMNRVMTTEDREGGFIVSFERVSRPHARRARRRTAEGAARLSDVRLAAHTVSGEDTGSPKLTRPNKAQSSWDLLVSAACRARRAKAIGARWTPSASSWQPGADVNAFIQAQRANPAARRAAAVEASPPSRQAIQGEGGVRCQRAVHAPAAMLRHLRRAADFRQGQTGWG